MLGCERAATAFDSRSNRSRADAFVATRAESTFSATSRPSRASFAR